MIKPINSVSFKSVYRTKDKQFTSAQYTISEMLKNRIQSRYYIADADRNSYDTYLNKRGYDVIIEPADKDSVKLSVVKGLKLNEKTNELKYKKSIFIGNYCINSDFNPMDIKEKLSTGSFNSGHIIPPLILLIGLLTLLITKSCNAEQKAKQLIENRINSDTIKKSTQMEYIRNLR